MGLLTRTRIEPEPIQVASKHIPFVEALWLRLEAAREGLSLRSEYLRTAGQLGVQTASLIALADSAVVDARAVKGADRLLNGIKWALSLGCEPTSPPEQWYCGYVVEPKKDRGDRYPRETWPSRNQTDAWGNQRSLLFQGAMPITALRRYAAVKDALHDFRVYSPRQDDFRVLRDVQPIDPVLIGFVKFLDRDVYLEIARWDIDKDLIEVFGKHS